MSEQTFDPAASGLPAGTTMEDVGEYRNEIAAPEAPAEASPAPAEAPPAPEPAPEPVEAKAPDGYVDKRALDAERIQRKEERQRRLELEERIRQLEARLQPPQPAPEPLTYADPIAEPEKARQYMETQAQRLARLEREIAEQRHVEQVRAFAMADEARFRAETPDYDAAAQHFMTTRLAEMEALGMDPDDARVQLRNEAVQTIAYARQRGMSPAEIVYRMAKVRGYAPAKAAEPAPPPPPPPAAPVTPPPAAAIQAHAAAQSATASLPAAGGAAPTLNPRAAAEMSEEEWAALPKKERQRILRGG